MSRNSPSFSRLFSTAKEKGKINIFFMACHKPLPLINVDPQGWPCGSSCMVIVDCEAEFASSNPPRSRVLCGCSKEKANSIKIGQLNPIVPSQPG